jgi:elongation factor 1-alpha
MISGAAQADVALLIVPADGNFSVAIQKGVKSSAEIQGQTRAHARILSLLGIHQLIVGVNKMDVAGWREDRFSECCLGMREMLSRVGWKSDFIAKSVPFIPLSASIGEGVTRFSSDNSGVLSSRMSWWKGCDVLKCSGEVVRVISLLSALEDGVTIPVRRWSFPLRLPISGVFKIKGVGDVLSGRVEQGCVSAGDDLVFLPTHSSVLPCSGKVFSVERSR